MFVFIFLVISVFADTAVDEYARFVNSFYKSAPSEFVARVHGLVSKLENKKYIIAPLGEGERGEFDQSPVARIDGFDCQTYIESVLAISMAKNYAESIKLLFDIRYSAGYEYFTRNHFPTIDWFPNALNKNILKPIDRAFLNKYYKSATQVINKKNWVKSADINRIKLKDSSRSLIALEKMRASAKNFAAKDVEIFYIPFDRFFIKGDKASGKQVINYELLNHLPNILVVGHVRLNWYLSKLSTGMLVSHLGLIYKYKDHWFYTEASSIQGKVVRVSLESFLKRMVKSKKVAGLYMLQVNDKWLPISVK